MRRPASASVRRTSAGNNTQSVGRRRPISANPRLKHKGNRVESKQATRPPNPYRPPRRRPLSAVARLTKKGGKKIGWRPAKTQRPKSAAFDRHNGPNEVE